ncbi:glycoside hydrolase family 28 protein [Acidobacterium sp. S8]|uniref:glycoside hydrolase family 28 protein n=1 Tax=Acidobacterium sp. S8 TaxID=1641854 RepID=UPI00131DE52C|nr:glycosyl hydrolase family 28 protein [Acidobacterium sp. S8]
MKKLLFALIFLLLPTCVSAQPAQFYNIRSFGAKGDGLTLDTTAVSAAIAACVKNGGGTVYFPAGRYVIGTVQLYSHTHLLLDSGAALVGSHNINDYLPSPPFGFARNYGVDITGEGTLLGMLIAKDAEDISIDGQGEIDGQGDSFMALRMSHGGNDYEEQYVRNPAKFQAAMSSMEYGPVEPDHRPGTMMVFFHCANVMLHGITLRSAPNWTLHLQDVEGAAISDIQILNDPRIPNNDGIDCMKCQHVRISNCNIDTGDDGFAIVGSEHVNVSNCSISSRSAAIRLESTKLSTFTGLSMDTNRGIAIFANGYVGQESRPTEDITFSNIVIRTHLIPGGWWGKAEPIYIAVQPCASSLPCGVRVRNVVFNNITAETENGVLLWGGKGTPITGVEFRGVQIHMLVPDPSLSESIGGNLDLRWTALTPRDGIVKSDVPAFYAKLVNGLRLRDVQVDWADSVPYYFSEGIRVEDFHDLTIDSFQGRQAQSASGAAIALQNGSGVSITNSRALPGTQTYGVDIAALALQFCLAHRLISTTLVGMSTAAEVEANLAAATRDPEPELFRRIRSGLDSEVLVPWRSGRPENQDLRNSF